MNRRPAGNTLSEPQTRYVIIDPALRDADWNLEDWTQVGPVGSYDAEPWNGVTDYKKSTHTLGQIHGALQYQVGAMRA